MHISLAAEELFRIGPFPVTNSLITTWIVTILLISVAVIGTKKLKRIPRGLQNVLEYAIESFLNLIESVTGDKKQARQFFPFVATIFFFVVFANWIGLLPGVGTIGIKEHHAADAAEMSEASSEQTEGEEVLIPLFRPANTDLNTTLALAVSAVLGIQFFGIMSIGFFKYASKYINFKGPISFFIGILELISEFARMISFSFRLFGNIFAGEVLLTVIAFLLPFIAPLPFYFLEIFVGFIQGLVFAMLTLVFLKIAVTPHEHEEAHA